MRKNGFRSEASFKEVNGEMLKRIGRLGLVIALVTFVLSMFGEQALATPPTTIGNLGHNGPTIPKLGDPVDTVSEVQWITVTPAASPTGSYKLVTSLGTSVSVTFNTSPATALTTLYGAGTVTATGGPTSKNFDSLGNLLPIPFYYRIMWVKARAGFDFTTMTVDSTGLTNVTVTVDPYQDGQTIATARNQPHGGYAATTDYCLQCHAVHQGSDYALLAQSSVTATCQTCHSLGGTAPTGTQDPGLGTGAAAPTSLRSAYEISGDPSGHSLGSTTIPFGTGPITESGWAYGGFSTTGWSHSTAAGAGTSSDTAAGGLYCGDCHTPHGDFGQLVNTKFYRSTAPAGAAADLSNVWTWAEGGAIYIGSGVQYLHKDTDPANVWESCTATSPAAVAAGPDTGCAYLTTTDSEGEGSYLYGYKLLSSYPNHSWDQKPVSWNTDKYSHDQAQWCGRCHDKALPSVYGGTYHNHPTGCSSCHGNPNDATSTDYPHTSTFTSLLKDYPDLLCINCHTAGSLP